MGRTVAYVAASCLLAAAAVVACGALGSVLGDEPPPPSAGVGPFRALESGEVVGVAPFVMETTSTPYHEPSALAGDVADAASMSVVLYAVTPAGGDAGPDANVIVRTTADDARTFLGTPDAAVVPTVVLRASLPWEGGSVSGPSAVRVGSEVYLYYAAAGGVGVARSPDGVTFTKEAAPVLAPDASVAWETTAPFAPSVAQLPDGTFDMMYAAGIAIGEATSPDGLHFTRKDGDPTTPAMDPALRPSGAPPPVPDAGADAGDAGVAPPFDMTQVSDPCVLPVTSPAGRLVVRVLYTGYSGPATLATRSSAIGLAARFGASGPLVRQPDAVFSIDKQEAAPTVFAWSGGTMLYVHANGKEGLFSPTVVSIAAGVAPTSRMLSVLNPDAGTTL